jgi:hypothetical protein
MAQLANSCCTRYCVLITLPRHPARHAINDEKSSIANYLGFVRENYFPQGNYGLKFPQGNLAPIAGAFVALHFNGPREFIVTPIHAMPARLPALRLAAIAAAILVLSSCGGGGGSSAPAASVAAPSTAASTATAAQAFTGAAGADGWTRCAVEGEVCIAAGARQVRYGIDGRYAYQNVNGPIGCNNAAFGDPAIGLVKSCQYAAPDTVAAGTPAYVRAASGRVLAVGPGRPYAKPCQALTAAADGDTVEIDAAGNYDGDTCAFHANDLTVRGVNGRPKIDAKGNYSWGKGTWVITGKRAVVDNIELSGARVPDRNGAAIRLDGVHLTLRNSYFHDNENGILTSNDGESDILIENSEFGHNGNGSGSSHNLYIGSVGSLIVRNSYSHDADVGHNLKSRARVNTISYSRFSSTRPGEPGGAASGEPSYEIDLPNAGTAYLIGNVIEQPASNQNSNMVSFGVEGASNPGKNLYVVNNTFINDDSSNGMFLLIGGDVQAPALVQNNVFAGTGNITSQSGALIRDNYHAPAPAFVNRAGYDLRPAAGASFIGGGSAPGYSPSGVALAPAQEYLHVAGGRARAFNGRWDIGAYSAN